MSTTGTQTCYRHPSRETGVSCSNCGNPICPSCMTPTPVGMRCPDCARQKTQVRRMNTSNAFGGGATQATVAIIVLNVIAFIASGQTSFNASNGTQIFQKGALFGPAIDINHQYWRIVTSGFLHVSIIHIGFNMYILWFLGSMLEPALGMRRFLGIYAVSLLAGSFGALVLSPNTVTVGASGAVFGLMGAAFFEMRGRGIDPMASGIGPMIILNLVLSFALSNISIGGHIGGLIGGSLAALALQEGDKRRQPMLGYAALCGIGVISVAGALLAAHAGLPADLKGVSHLPGI